MTPVTKEVVKFYSSNWSSIEIHTAIAAYLVENGYEYPVEMVTGVTGTMMVALPLGEMEVVMEMWRQNIMDWYDTEIAAGTIVDLAGTGDNVTNGSPGQILENSAQGIYVPTYVIEANPGLVSVLDLPDYVDLFRDPEDPTKGVLYNCIIGWACQKIIRAKWFAYGLYDTFNVAEPGSAGALDANLVGAYDAGDAVLSYYWEPTTIVAELDLTMLEEPVWNQECQVALDIATDSSPYESTIGCAFPVADVHTGVYSGLAERAPEVTGLLANVFVGALVLGDLEVWRNDNDAVYRDVGVKWLKENRDTWITWITDANAAEIIANVDSTLAVE
jgi:glycine betaine/proline transport system substrate-binding protein